MHSSKSNASLVLPIGLMLFSFFFGAGNLIFPPILGQMAGENLVMATLAFCITGVGFPLLGVLAMAINRHEDPDGMAMPVHPTYARAVTLLCALTIGPLFAIPRTAATSYDTGIMFLLPTSYQDMGLAAYSLFFFAMTYFMSINPSKIVDNIGKVMTPILLGSLAVLICAAVFSPVGPAEAPTGEYATAPFFKGFVEGYNTMDLLASLLFGAAAIKAIEGKGVTDQKELTSLCIKAGFIAAGCLGAIYTALSYTGATSASIIREATNGGQMLNIISAHYFGGFGKIVLATIIFFACITTSIGLTTAISSYFEKLTGGKISYKTFVTSICVFSFAISNVGLSNIIQFSIPVLCILYPITIAMVLLNVGKNIFHGDKYIFRSTMILTTIFSIFDGLRAAGIDTGAVNTFLAKVVPLYEIGFGWVLPCFGGIVLGYILKAVCGSK